jgi:hypothetical protein
MTMNDEKNFYKRVGVIAVLLIIGYYIFSPYQNCVRDMGVDESAFCTLRTGW